jgi:hypothetical protein
LRHPKDLIYLPAYVVFVYCHSWIKLWAGMTFYELAWGSRVLEAHGAGDDREDHLCTSDSKSPGTRVLPHSQAIMGLQRRKHVRHSMTIDLEIEKDNAYPLHIAGYAGFATDEVKLSASNMQLSTEERFEESSAFHGIVSGCNVTSKIRNEVSVEGRTSRKTD